MSGLARENRTGVFEMPQDPELPDLFRVALRELRLEMRTHTAATVTAYNPTTQKVAVTVDILQIIKDFVTPPTAANPNPVKPQDPVPLVNLPVAWPRTNSGYLTFPLNAGDTGELHVQDRSLQQWLQIGKATDPVSAFTHCLADSVFHPDLHADNNSIVPPTDQTATVLDGDTLIKIGRGALDFVALAALVLTELQKVQTWATTHTHLYSPGPGAPVITATAVPVLAAPAPVAATKAQAE